MSNAVVRAILRTFAVGIAVLAAVDPPITSTRSLKPVVVVSAVDSARDASLVDRVSTTLNKRFTVSRSEIAGPSAWVIVGERPPSKQGDDAAPVFAVLPDTLAPGVSIERVAVPATAPSDARVPVVVQVSVRGATGRSLDVSLRAGGSVADHATRRFGRSDSTLTIPLSFVPTATGAIPVRVTVTMSGAATELADAAVTVHAQRWAVLFFDARPSWTSTFVRRAIERDPRFVVTSRIVTSRNVSADAGRPPARLDDLAALSVFDAVVVGAPEGLSPADVGGLEAFMRRRGGSVLLLLDQRTAGAYDRLTGVANWASSGKAQTLTLPFSDSATLRATEMAWPSALPAGATTVTAGGEPVVWQSPVGMGRLVVSGALDAWRFRDSSTSGFDRFWRVLLARSAAGAPPPVSVAVSSAVAAPGEVVEVNALVRDAAFQPAFTNVVSSRTIGATIAARLEPGQPPAAGIPQSIRLWPASDVGHFTAALRAPRDPGMYRIVVASGAATTETSLIVDSTVRRATPVSRDLLEVWAMAHGGRAVHASELGRLPDMLGAAIRPPSRVETWHPMRSAWWIVPFVLALSGEWWLRRRRGLA